MAKAADPFLLDEEKVYFFSSFFLFGYNFLCELVIEPKFN